MSKSVKQTSIVEDGKKNVEKVPRKSGKSGKTAKQIMSRHIKDKNDVITDEEFKDLDVVVDITKDSAHQPLDIPENPEHPKDEDKDPKIITLWDVIT